MRVFVTGATGLLGSNLCHLLIEKGHEVVALVRDPDKARQQLPENINFVIGDLESIAAIEDDLAACDGVVHCAAYFREYYKRGNHWPRLERLNVEATMQLAEMAYRQGVKRFVHISSSGTVGDPGDESAPPGPEVEHNLYFKSKVLADRRLAEWPHSDEVGLVTVLPGWMFGPRDAAPTGSGQLVRDFLAGQLPAVPPGGTTVVDARDVADAIVRVLEQDTPSDRYIVAGRPATLREIADGLERVSGKPAPRWNLPYLVALLLATLLELVARLFDKDPLMTRSAVRTMAHNRHHFSRRAERELGVEFRPLEETLRDCVEWARAH
ncbi:MAG: NAD-dependent epimerase/dehydratase family protein [Candidatus Eremiobacteraeota bacterium]|nr:NAD-dependent epimerase/dehydratase family protein [Candidatus Eremiobacteraeota bacterium]